MIELFKEKNGLEVRLTAVTVGADISVTIGGGEKPHIGAVALGIPSPSSHTPGKINASVSVLTLTGHKEDELARKAAGALASTLERVVVVSCGIHKDAISAEEIQDFGDLVDALVTELTHRLK